MNYRTRIVFIVLTLFTNILLAKDNTTSPDRIQSISTGFKQNPDSLKELTILRLKEKNNSELDRVISDYVLGLLSFKSGHTGNAEKYWSESLRHAKSIDDTAFTIELLNKLGELNTSKEDFEKAMNYFADAHTLAIHYDNAYLMSRVLVSSGKLALNRNDYSKAGALFYEATYQITSFENSREKWCSFYRLNKVYEEIKGYSGRWEVAKEMEKVARALNDTLLLGKTQSLLAGLHLEKEEYVKAASSLKNALVYFESIQSQKNYGEVLLKLVDAYLINQNLQRANDYLSESWKFIPQQNDSTLLVKLHLLQAETDLLNNEIQKSIEHAGKALNIIAINPSVQNYSGEAVLSLAKGHFLQKHFQEAEEYALKCLNSKGIALDSPKYLEAVRILADIKCQKNEFSACNEYRGLEVNLLKSVYNQKESAFKTTAAMNLDYMSIKVTEEQKSRFEKQTAELLFQKSKCQWIVSGLLLVFLATLLILKMYCNKRKSNRKLEVEHSTVRNQAKKLKEIDSLKSRFFTNISHEFRTPLTLISGPAEQLEQKLEGEDAKKINSIKTNTKRLLKLVNQILELAELESQAHVLKLQKLPVRPFIQQIVESFEPMAESRNISFTYYINCSQLSVYLDQESIEKVIVNLLSNAFKYTDDNGSIQLKVSCNSDWFEVSVEDNGIGIGEEEQKHIFDMFYYTESDQSVSSGIGLSLVSALVKSHCGSINVESQKEVGSTFSVSIPTDLKVYEANDVHYSIANDGASEYEQKPSNSIQLNDITHFSDSKDHQDTIMIVDDNHEIRNYINNFLGARFRVLAAKNGLEGIEKAKEFLPDLILCDIMMPELDGFGLVRELKNDEKTSHIPIVLLTAKGDKESRIEGLSLQADDYLTKPFDQHELIVRIDNLIQSRRRMQERFSSDLMLNTSELAGPSSNQMLIERIMMIIEERIDDTTLSVDELAREAGLSRSQLHRKIVALTGKSTSVFIRNIRLRVAHEMLKKQVGNISEISDKVGFSSPSYFNRCFKEMYGVTPSVILNQATDELNNFNQNESQEETHRF